MAGFMKVLSEFEVDSAEYSASGETVYCDRYDTLVSDGYRLRLYVRGEFVTRNGRIVRWTDRFSWAELVGKSALTMPRAVLHLLSADAETESSGRDQSTCLRT